MAIAAHDLPILDGRLKEVVQEYLISCEARGLSPRTVHKNKGPVLLGLLLPWCQEHGIDDPAGLDRRALDRWTLALRQRPGRQRATIGNETVRGYLKIVNAFLQWLAEEREVPAAVRLKLPRVGRRRVDVLSLEEVRRMLRACTNDRDRAIVQTLWETGCRIGELLGLETSDVLVRGGQRLLLIRSWRHDGGSKGATDRHVPAPDVYRAIRTYLAGRPTDTTSSRVFLSRQRSARTGQYEPIQRKGVELMLQEVARRAGIGRHVHPHLFRHSAVTHWHRRGMDPGRIAHIIGDTLQTLWTVYLHSESEDGYMDLAGILEGDRAGVR